MFLALTREKPAVLEVCDVATLMNATVSVSCGDLESAEAQLHLQMPEDLPPALADPDHITQVFSNLIVNARHAVQELGQDAQMAIRVQCDDKGQHVTIVVEDNEPGVPTDIQSRIFEPFFTTKDVGSGTGFGLA